jgi:hypothetical protein
LFVDYLQVYRPVVRCCARVGNDDVVFLFGGI